MNLALITIAFSSLLGLSYYFYGRYLAAVFGLDDNIKTPAHTKADSKDFVATAKFYLFGQHFSAISAAGPIAGPILACSIWGWLPCLIWICFGVIFIGAVHDFSILTASMKHEGKSIADITRKYLGNKAGLAMLLFIWIALIYVIIAFTELTASSFVGVSEELSATKTWFNPGGAVAAAAIMYLTLSIFLGLVERYIKPPLWLSTIIFVPLSFFAVFVGSKFSTVFILDLKTWSLLILGYCFIASLLPVWLLLQPRGYLGGFFLYTVIAIGLFGILFGDFEIKQSSIILENSSGLFSENLFPFLFVTIACGACSGFHGLVCSGTTSKQISKESHSKSIGYGAMLCEAVVAIIALATIMIWSRADIAGLKPGAIYSKGIGEFICTLIGKEYIKLATVFGAIAFSTFIFDTLDVSTRLGRYLLQELFGFKGTLSNILMTLATIFFPFIFVFLAQSDSYIAFWTLFGASNQLLAALTLLTISAWLYKRGKNFYYTLLPMAFILFITLWALSKIAIHNFSTGSDSIQLINGLVAIVLILLSIYLILSATYHSFASSRGLRI